MTHLLGGKGNLSQISIKTFKLNEKYWMEEKLNRTGPRLYITLGLMTHSEHRSQLYKYSNPLNGSKDIHIQLNKKLSCYLNSSVWTGSHKKGYEAHFVLGDVCDSYPNPASARRDIRLQGIDMYTILKSINNSFFIMPFGWCKSLLWSLSAYKRIVHLVGVQNELLGTVCSIINQAFPVCTIAI